MIKHKIRNDGKYNTKTINLTAKRAIIEFCKECLGFNTAEVRRCTDSLCPLYPFRTHDRPKNTC